MAHFGWSWDYLHYEVSWPAVCRMLADGPRYDSPNQESDGEVVVTEENAEAVARILNGV